MTLDVLCLIVLIAVLLLSCVTALNVGLAALAAAWVIGGYVAPHFDDVINLKTVVAGFPVDLFLNLVGTTLLFAAAQTNGTLAVVVEAGVRMARGRAMLVPPLFFGLGFASAWRRRRAPSRCGWPARPMNAKRSAACRGTSF